MKTTKIYYAMSDFGYYLFSNKDKAIEFIKDPMEHLNIEESYLTEYILEEDKAEQIWREDKDFDTDTENNLDNMSIETKQIIRIGELHD